MNVPLTNQNNQNNIHEPPIHISTNQAPQNQGLATSHHQNNQLPPQKQYKVQESIPSQEESYKYYFISLALFLAAFGVFIAVWVIERFAVTHEVSSHYYEKSYNWAGIPTTLQQTVSSTATGIALKLILEWLTWKGPLIIFTYNCIRLNPNISKWISLGVHFGLLLTIDILLTIFVLEVYNNMIYFGIYVLFNVGVAAFNNSGLDRTKQAIFDSFFPLLWIAFAVIVMVLLLPILYKIYFDNMQIAAMFFLLIYLFPVIDLIMFGLLIFSGTFLSEEVRTFHSMLHFLLLGLEVGFTLLIGYTEVQFFYLITYYVLRNVFCSYVMFRWQKRLNLPAALPLWVLVYYFSYIVNFLPYSGIGNVRTSTGYYSVLLIASPTVLYGVPSSLYPNNLYTAPTSFNDDLNTSLNGNIYFIAALIVWIGLTFSNRYSKKMPEIVFNIVYYTFGIYLFYTGLGAGLSTSPLYQNSVIA